MYVKCWFLFLFFFFVNAWKGKCMYACMYVKCWFLFLFFFVYLWNGKFAFSNSLNFYNEIIKADNLIDFSQCIVFFLTKSLFGSLYCALDFGDFFSIPEEEGGYVWHTWVCFLVLILFFYFFFQFVTSMCLAAGRLAVYGIWDLFLLCFSQRS